MKAPRITGLVFVCLLAVLLAAGCAKKKVGPDATEGSAAEAQAEAEARAEAERQARLREQTLGEDFQEAVQDITERIHFGYDSFELNPDAREILQTKAREMKKFSNITLVIEGYCDERGTEEYNLALGERRARSVYEFLVLLGVEPHRMSIVSFGEENPIAPGDNEAAWAMNRRCEFRPSY